MYQDHWTTVTKFINSQSRTTIPSKSKICLYPSDPVQLNFENSRDETNVGSHRDLNTQTRYV